jgi:hypothetical protein
VDETPELEVEVQDLTWAMIDEQATDSQLRRLGDLLQASGEARRVYVTCMQMHADLCFLLGGKKTRLPAAIQKRNRQKKTASAASLQPAGLPTAVADVPLMSPAAS